MMSDNENMETKPTIETLLTRINRLGNNLQSQFDSLQADVTSIKSDVTLILSDVTSVKSDVTSVKSDMVSVKSDVSSLRNEFQLFRGEMEIRIDRVEGMTNQTRAEMLNLRADFREWKDLLNASDA
jgi:peptidoglycan hydrolase CwlO-like protein